MAKRLRPLQVMNSRSAIRAPPGPNGCRRAPSSVTARIDKGGLVVSFAVSNKEPLHADEHWEEKDGKRRIIRVEPGTSERFVVSRTPRDVKVYFQVLVDPVTANVTVLIDLDISSFNGQEVERG